MPYMTPNKPHQSDKRIKILASGQRAVHPEVVGNGPRHLRRFNLSTPLRSENFSVFPIQTPKRAEARAPNEHQQLRDARASAATDEGKEMVATAQVFQPLYRR